MNHSSLLLRSSLKAIVTAVDKSKQLLDQDETNLDSDAIHSVKSVLYAAIEQTRTGVERLATLQRMLRELLVIITSNVELKTYEREVGRQIIQEIVEHCVGLNEKL